MLNKRLADYTMKDYLKINAVFIAPMVLFYAYFLVKEALFDRKYTKQMEAEVKEFQEQQA